MGAADKLPDQSWRAVVEAAQPGEVEGYLIDELFKAMGLGGDSLWRSWFGPAFLPLVRRFVQRADAFDRSVAKNGLQHTAQTWLAKWIPGLQIEVREELPRTGPLLIAANHPGTFDGLAVVSSLPREDLKIVAAANPFMRAFPNTRRYFIYSTLDTHVRMATIRGAFRHLQGGGALLIFSSGKLDPDPRYFPGAASRSLERWSASLELFLRKVPETRLVIAINSGFVAPEYLRHPLTRLRRSDEARQKLAEFIQVIRQVLYDHQVTNKPCVVFTQPVTFSQLNSSAGNAQSQIIAMAQRLVDYSSDSLRNIPDYPVPTTGAGSN